MIVQSPLNTPFEMQRHYNIFTFNFFINLIPFHRWRIFRPYAGIHGGIFHIRDYRISETAIEDIELLTYDTVFTMGARAGFSIVPFSSLSIFVEGRYYFQPAGITRSGFINQGIGSELLRVDNNIKLHYLSIGGGVKFLF